MGMLWLVSTWQWNPTWMMVVSMVSVRMVGLSCWWGMWAGREGLASGRDRYCFFFLVVVFAVDELAVAFWGGSLVETVAVEVVWQTASS